MKYLIMHSSDIKKNILEFSILDTKCMSISIFNLMQYVNFFFKESNGMNINIVQKYWHIIDQNKHTFTWFIYIYSYIWFIGSYTAPTCNKGHYISSISFSSIFINGALFKVGIDWVKFSLILIRHFNLLLLFSVQILPQLHH